MKAYGLQINCEAQRLMEAQLCLGAAVAKLHLPRIYLVFWALRSVLAAMDESGTSSAMPTCRLPASGISLEVRAYGGDG